MRFKLIFSKKKLLKFIALILTLYGCKTENKENTKLISPIENIKICNSSKYIIEKNNSSDSLQNIEAILNIKNLKIVASNNSIYIFDNLTNKLKKKYSFKLKLISIKFSTNTKKSKLLIIASGQSLTSLVFQIDLNLLKIDWFSEYSKQIEMGCYANNSEIIALGTNYAQKKTKENTSEYYSSLFILNSTTGKFIDYFKQGESVLKIEFSKDDDFLYAVLNWPHTDTFVWNLNNKNEKIGAFGKDNTSFYDTCIIDEKNFVSLGSDGIYKWNISKPEKYEIVYNNDNKYINASDKIFKIDNIFILVDYPNGSANPPTIKYLDSKFKLTNSVKMKTDFDNIAISDFKLTGIGDNNKIIYFNIKNKSIIKQ